MEVTEGGVTVEVPEQSGDGKEGVVFFNPEQELNRDLTVAVLRAHGSEPGTYLDATAASGIRGVRAAREGWTATCCDVDPAAVELAGRNFRRNGLDGETLHRDARPLLYERRFDVVDVDPFGTPIPFADPAANGAQELLCVTATDTAPLCGAHFDSGVRSYSTVPRNTEYHPEMGLRVLLSALARTAARYDVGVAPRFCHATRHYVRAYLGLERSATDANAAVEELGYVDHCQDCLYRRTVDGLIADPLDACPNCGGERVVTAGPLWLGPTRDSAFLGAVRRSVTDEFGTADRARGLLGRIAGELDRPTHYDQHRLCEQWGVGATAMEEFLDRLRDAGFAAARTHFGGTTFETDADVAQIRAATVEE
jgi:tRNA (guanine26-N2/guanine27-N2)-dimethyltransferase